MSHTAKRMSPWPVAWWNRCSLSTPVRSIREMLMVNMIGSAEVSTPVTTRAVRRRAPGRVKGWLEIEVSV